jgi:hypothetical protein
VAITALALAFWDYGGALIASTNTLTDAPTERLSTLQLSNEHRVDLYGRLIDLLLLLYGLAVVRILTGARRANLQVARTIKVAAATVPVLALVLWQVPYRLMYHSTFQRVDLETVRCYRLGENTEQVLLHCPDAAPPRNRIVSSADPRLRDRGVAEHLFTSAGSSQPKQ